MLHFIHRRFSIGARLGLIAALLMVPVVMFAGLFVAQSMKEIRFAEREVEGAHYIEAARGLFQPGTNENVQALAAARAIYDMKFETTEAADLFAEADDPNTRRSAGRAFLIAVADASNLTLDPDLDSYYVMDLYVLRVAALIDAVAFLRDTSGVPDHPEHGALPGQRRPCRRGFFHRRRDRGQCRRPNRRSAARAR